MKFTLSLATAAALATFGSAQFMINTPNAPTQCVPTQISWSGGTGPFFLSINTNDANGAPEQTYDNLAASPFVWQVNITGGTQHGLALTDRSNGAKALSGVFTITPSSDTSCLNGAVPPPASAPGSSSAGSTGGAPTSAPPASTPAGPTTGATSPSPSSAASSGSSAAHSSSSSGSASPSGAGGSSSGALANTVSAGLVGVVGALAAMIVV
ncbi:hypothetical protein BDW22DRAFT_159199 [Trametopsis cervina]|nr:hypothetical protein BDW22DRAFT_159199 [Trametopsis cervina]